MDNNEKRRVNLILGPGGARGFVHVGVIKALVENGFEIQSIIGISMGAMIGWYYGYCKDIEKCMAFTDQFNKVYKDLVFYRMGLLKLNTPKLREFLIENTDNKDYQFNELKIPLSVVATNIKTGKYEFLNKGSVVDACIASSNYPFINPPYKINGKLYVDGGLVHDIIKEVPCELQNDYPYLYINLDHRHDIFANLWNRVMKRVLHVYYRKHLISTQLDESKSEIFINVKSLLDINAFINNVDKYDFNKARECLIIGEDAVSRNIKDIEKFLYK